MFIIVLKSLFLAFGYMLADKYGRNKYLWALGCAILPFLALILLQMGSRTNPNKIFTIKSVVPRIIAIVFFFTLPLLIKNFPMDDHLRAIEAKLISEVVKPSISQGPLVISSNAQLEIPSGVLNTPFALCVWGIIYGLLFFKKQPWVTVEFGLFGFTLGVTTKLLKDILFCVFYFDNPSLFDGASYVQFTQTAIVAATHVLLGIAIVYALVSGFSKDEKVITAP